MSGCSCTYDFNSPPEKTVDDPGCRSCYPILDQQDYDEPIEVPKDKGFDWPRRSSLPHRSPAENSISVAVNEVEHMGCDVLLTEAVVLLGQARDKVADYIDKMNPSGATVRIGG